MRIRGLPSIIDYSNIDLYADNDELQYGHKCFEGSLLSLMSQCCEICCHVSVLEASGKKF